MQQIAIRAASPDDFRVIADFNCRLAIETENKTLVPEVVEAGVRAMFEETSRGRYFVACTDDTIVGQLMHTWEWSDWRNGEIWWLQSVYILPDFRGQGIFRSLYRNLEDQARVQGNVVGLRLYVENQNERAQQAYRALGMQQAGYQVMERFLNQS